MSNEKSGKKTTDLNSMLGSARRAEQVQRPTIQAPEEPAPKEEKIKRVCLMLDAELHRRLKVLGATSNTPIQELGDKAILDFLQRNERL